MKRPQNEVRQTASGVSLVKFNFELIKKFLPKFKNIKTGTSFQKGDSVTAFGNKGVVKEVSANGFVIVKFDDFDSTVVFNTDGRLMKWHKQVSLKHV